MECDGPRALEILLDEVSLARIDEVFGSLRDHPQRPRC
jgi:hypothetical protein